MAKIDETGVRNKRGKCEIRWYEGSIRRTEVLTIKYSPTGIQQAQKIRAHKEKAWATGEDREIGFVRAPTFNQMAQKYLDDLELTTSRSSLLSIGRRLENYWNHHLGAHVISQIKKREILEIVRTCRQNNLSPKSIRNVLSAGSAVFELAIIEEWITENPTTLVSKDVKVPKKKIDPFNQDEMDQVFPFLNKTDRLFYSIRWYCGLRPGEVIALTWDDYRDDYFSITKSKTDGELGETKTDRDRTVPVHPKVAAMLAEAQKVRQLHSNQILINQYGAPYQATRSFARRFSEAMRKTQVRNRSPYNVRHGCATRMLEAGMKPGYCAKVLGHSMRVFFEIYADWIDRAETEIQEKIWASME